MRKILFVFSLFLSLSLILACSDDDNSDPKLSFGRPIYILKAAEPLAVELIVSEPVTEEIKVPFMIDGSAVLDEDYTISAKEFVLHPGDWIDTGDSKGERDRTEGDSPKLAGGAEVSFVE